MLLLVIRKVEDTGASGLSQDVWTVLDQQWPAIVAAAVSGCLLAILYFSFFRQRQRRSPWAARPLPAPRRKLFGRSAAARGKISVSERRFRNVFALVSEERRLAIIEHYMRKHGCGREEAMDIAVEARARDED